MTAPFQRSPDAALLQAAECHVWWADPRDHPIDTIARVLSPTEQDRAARYRREGDRHRFITGGWLLRTAAATYLGVSPAAVPVIRSCPRCNKPHGKPQVTHTGLHVSVSHAGNRVAVALSTAGPVGVDVEAIPTTPPEELSRRALSSAERAALADLPAHAQNAAFIRLWVCKEAALKATGHGLSIPPGQVHISYPHTNPALVSWPLRDTPPGNVRLHLLKPVPGYHAAVAIISTETVTITEITACPTGARPGPPQ
ncbi:MULTISPECIES: 4'-phosphopantetheinyl transferase family protein [unclassified Streptosporangium]|uniref:4'-phosphopantetheinyl transferase family protein n=1 Tax=Streptosporangium sp. NPDC005286 TaxID=3154463 RepID=UPI0033AAB109